MERFSDVLAQMDDILGAGRNFDMVSRDLTIAGSRARLYVVNGYAKEDILERIIAAWQALPRLPASAEDFVASCVAAADAQTEPDAQKAAVAVFSGKTLLLVERYQTYILLEAKTYPTRSVQEPDTSRVLRGSHDGFTENIMENAALLRRRVRDSHLTLEIATVGGRSRQDVAMIYMAGEAEEDMLSELRQKLEAKRQVPGRVSPALTLFELTVFQLFLLMQHAFSAKAEHLPMIAFAFAALIVLEIVVICIKYLAPESAASVQLQNMFNGVYNGLSSIFGG